MYQKTAKNHLCDNVNCLLNLKPGHSHSVLKKLGAHPGDDADEDEIQLPEFDGQKPDCRTKSK